MQASILLLSWPYSVLGILEIDIAYTPSKVDRMGLIVR